MMSRSRLSVSRYFLKRGLRVCLLGGIGTALVESVLARGDAMVPLERFDEL